VPTLAGVATDVSVQVNQRRKLVFVWKDGDVLFDGSGAYAVEATLFSHKGAYRHDASGAQGTLLHTVRHERRSTASELVAYAADGLRQCQQDPETGVTSARATATRERTGVWTLTTYWTSPQGPQQRSLAF